MEIDTSRSLEAAAGVNRLDTKERPSLGSIDGPIHFVGIGGIGMSALARLLLADGSAVSGSDKAASEITEELSSLGAQVFVGHQAENVGKAKAIVLSTAINKENPELAAALEKELPVYHRSEVLAYLASKKKLLAISGTHGKTTTTGMLAEVLLDSGKDPSVVVGGIFARMKSNAHAGKGEHFVAEADESDRTHASMVSDIAVVTNIEPDHMENYPGGLEQILQTMASFANNANRCVVLCSDDPGCLKLMPLLQKRIVTYGEMPYSLPNKGEQSPDYRLKLVDDTTFSVTHHGTELGNVTLSVPGKHNKLNALATLVVALECGVAFKDAADALSKFRGVARRFDLVGSAHDILVIDDYGHHPTEVRATLEAAQQFRTREKPNGRIVIVFQPHQPGRLRDLWDDFVEAFKESDLLLLTDIYVARGGNIEGISSEKFSKVVKHHQVHYLPGASNELAPKIKAHLKPGDIVLTVGAGDITNVGRALLKLLQDEGVNGRNV
ncbi:MAG: UDP-N-acetylmuramate--L-alanine ligase [Candidatus Obscuribacterales bacterium]|nr:UDP-N-acetylmuramate--L-alanine ligase [Candidatus Obscuribacterales bacterium]